MMAGSCCHGVVIGGRLSLNGRLNLNVGGRFRVSQSVSAKTPWPQHQLSVFISVFIPRIKAFVPHIILQTPAESQSFGLELRQGIKPRDNSKT